MAFVKFEGKQYPLLPEETVLAALLRGGASVPSSCRKGSCQTCLMRVARGQVKHGAGSRLHPALSATGHFLPCVATAEDDLEVERPHLTQVEQRVRVTKKRQLSGGTVQLFLLPEAPLTWRAGQRLEVSSPLGDYSRYSIASCFPSDRHVELHVGVEPRGAVGSWLRDEVSVGEVLWVRPPQGKFHYDRSLKQRPLLLIGTGTGLASLLGVVRTALRDAHEAPISLYHGARSAEQLYGQEVLSPAELHSGFRFVECTSQTDTALLGMRDGNVAARAFDAHPELSDYAVFIAGDPDWVAATRVAAVRRGASRYCVLAEPFEPGSARSVHEQTKTSFEPEPELWQALGQGEGLRRVLEQFYSKVYSDALLMPFFEHSTPEHVLSQHCLFLAAAFSDEASPQTLTAEGLAARPTYPFGGDASLPISDELFDHRGSLLEASMRDYGLSEAMIRRWCGFDEQFRRESVGRLPEPVRFSASEQSLL